ncbi:NAD-glutamate dehydrogenase [Arsenicitalea aurantiaca]|uniref:NAD-glutamate dehydrogenase n=2 Tax=Arsenicitalea aurantiaca TaxID=1783274 RepID=A0A433X5W9_9HYPH|nr:NAD-glutamate dehydrogenase [Arsenicitalea aurantiaca]
MDAQISPAETHDRLLAVARSLEADTPELARFLKATLRQIEPEDLSGVSAEAMVAALRGARDRVRKGLEGPGRAVSVFPLDLPPAVDIVEIVSADMPFIVDSVTAAIRAEGGTVKLLAHPVFEPEALGRADGVKTSFLHIHLVPLADDKAREALQKEIGKTLDDVGCAVGDWQDMLGAVREAEANLEAVGRGPEDAEAAAFLAWLRADNFTFLGIRRYRIGEDGMPDPVAGAGLGILGDDGVRFLREGPDYVETNARHAAFLAEPTPIMVTKANLRARVHRRTHMDYVAVKHFDAEGRVIGETRILGHFTSHAEAAPHGTVPLVRSKLASVLSEAGEDPRSHAGKALLQALETYPRDDLFQIDPAELAGFARIIAGLADRPRVRVLSRIDRFDNFVSVLVYVPRERYDATVRERIGAHLGERYDGRVSAYYPQFLEGELVRVHFIIGRNGGVTPRPERAELEAEIAALTQNFSDRLAAAAPADGAVGPFLNAFTTAYQYRHGPEDALADIALFQGLGPDRPVAVRLRTGVRGASLGIRFYQRGEAIPLSARVPMLEAFGFAVIDEQTYTVTPRSGEPYFLHDMSIEPPEGVAVDVGEDADRIESAILAVWHGGAESDGLNRLVVAGRMAWRDVAILRALARYLRQIGLTYTRAYVAQVLGGQAVAANALVALFAALHDPAREAREAAEAEARETIALALEQTETLDEDRIVRRVLNLVEASLRTNAFQRDGNGRRRPAIAIKFDCHAIEALPAPRPYREIFVYSPRVEGLHLRFGPIARGGLRWSDRAEDFRTEVLGLVKAQQVKNSIIVPVGAKGAFVPRRQVTGGRDAVAAEGTACYEIFVSSLLDITDNIIEGRVVPPAGSLRRDGDDPYLVVAADKGTARFSDTANAIALERGYWLGDAFASGGSVGYDHKKMGITARGGWEAVKRHFREMDRDIQSEPFTVVGVGDMSGDVFGNAMLLSRQIRLLAAFDHRDIFIDPDPDPEKSFAERERLFALPRSSWQDYDPGLISAGGGVFPRSGKTVPLSVRARQMLGLGEGLVSPFEVMAAILRADADLLWFGGIGTYVRGHDETDAEVGDKANDAMRVSARQVRARVIGEGANLAVTQKGRIDFALAGGAINTDAIDNSAGVNSSDLEVNIKIALNHPLDRGALDAESRKAFLGEMTEEVAQLCLANNYQQSLALSLAQRRAVDDFPDHAALIGTLERDGHLERAVEFLPDEEALSRRRSAEQGLTRPELAVLLAYAKNTLQSDLLAGSAPDDPYLARELLRYFPQKLNRRFPEAIAEHRLRREVIATVLANGIINRGGPAFVEQLTAATSADAAAIARAAVLVREIYGLDGLHTDVDALDGKLEGQVQLGLYAALARIFFRETLFMLRNAPLDEALEDLVERFGAGVTEVWQCLPACMPPTMAGVVEADETALGAEGVPENLAHAIARLGPLSLASDIVLVANRAGESVPSSAEAFFGLLELFNLDAVMREGEALVATDRFERLALDRTLANLRRAQRVLTADILAAGSGTASERIAAWHRARADAVDRVALAVGGLADGGVSLSRLTVAAGLLGDLARGD